MRGGHEKCNAREERMKPLDVVREMINRYLERVVQLGVEEGGYQRQEGGE